MGSEKELKLKSDSDKNERKTLRELYSDFNIPEEKEESIEDMEKINFSDEGTC